MGKSVVLLLLVLLLAPTRAHARPKTIEGVINLNHATVAELELLPGVGPAKAERIIAYRQKRPFRTIEELGRVKGIGPRTVRKLRLFLTVRGPTTARLVGAPLRPGLTEGVSGAGQPSALAPATPGSSPEGGQAMATRTPLAMRVEPTAGQAAAPAAVPPAQPQVGVAAAAPTRLPVAAPANDPPPAARPRMRPPAGSLGPATPR